MRPIQQVVEVQGVAILDVDEAVKTYYDEGIFGLDSQ